MLELSLHILDIAQNSVKAGADLVHINVSADALNDRLTIRIDDNGCGMTDEELAHSADPFFTTNEKKRVGMGLPLFKDAVERAGGSFKITSKKGTGTSVKADFLISHIDRVPLGDMAKTFICLWKLNPNTDFVYSFSADSRSFELDTRDIKDILGEVNSDSPQVIRFIEEFIKENTAEAAGKLQL